MAKNLCPFRVIAIDNFSNATKGEIMIGLLGCYWSGADGMPVSLERVEELTGKSVTFLEADLRFHSDDDWAC